MALLLSILISMIVIYFVFDHYYSICELPRPKERGFLTKAL